MKMHAFPVWTLLVLSFIIGCASGGGAGRAVREREFKEKVNKTRSITVLPPVVQYFKRTNVGDEPMPEYNDMVFRNAYSGLEESLKQMGFQVKEQAISDALLYEDQKLARDLTHVRNDFSKALNEMSGARGDTEIRFSPRVNVFAERADAELILMAQGYGFETSGGKKAKDAVMAGVGAVFGYIPSVRFTGAQMVVLLIDGITGEVLWANYNSDTGYNAKDSHEMSVLTSRLLGPLNQ